VKRSGVSRRAKLYYLRDRVGKAVRLREKRDDLAASEGTAKKAAAEEEGHRQGLADGSAAMHARDELGRRGEDEAARYLRGIGYRIIARREKVLRGDIDIIALDDRTVVFVEVRSRTDTAHGHPVETVGYHEAAADGRPRQCLHPPASALRLLRPARRGDGDVQAQMGRSSSTFRTPSTAPEPVRWRR